MKLEAKRHSLVGKLNKYHEDFSFSNVLYRLNAMMPNMLYSVLDLTLCEDYLFEGMNKF